MFRSLFLVSLAVLVSHCGTQNDSSVDANSYQVNEELALTGNFQFKFQESHLYKSITIGAGQAQRCRDIAADFSQQRGVSINPSSLKILHSEPGKHCLRRDALKNCEKYEYIYSFTCQFTAN